MSDRATDLIAAYEDGVAELTADERRQVEALVQNDPAIRAEAEAAKALITELRALAPEGTEPDWTVLEREIRTAVGPSMPASPRRWLWRWLVPAGALAMTAGIAMLVLHHPHDGLQVAAPIVHARGDLTAPIEAPATGLWLDGHVVDVDDLDPALFDDDDDDGDALATGGLLPADDLRWIDSLDDGAIERAETWLDKKKKS